jgi:hypothetical protein
MLHANGETGVHPVSPTRQILPVARLKIPVAGKEDTGDVADSATIRKHFTEIALESRFRGRGTPFAEDMASSVATVGWAHCR